ncbi:YifB family Mg chelatase-like AAA ATPase [Paramicrobacterium agarici]|uniref:Magnesium chelatase family protein n=1 Tax=Paramicrobacterium agarici TaxID=630514 RepID=A0A2A9DYS1_9MICO|nr:YifB family Mg chelatase-like AAA ATPase [Microbacterium agarici]PFG31516.1 magnesium chelatase family protein [Microbacterium agarici]
MAVARTWAIALIGLDGTLIEVEADISAQLPAFVLIGLGDRSVREAEGRVRQAASNSGCRLAPHHITVNLSPASLPKHGAAFDLAIALACLAADATIDRDSVERVVHIGELGLDGRLRPTAGVLPAVRSAVREGRPVVMVPTANADEARLVPGATIVPVASLRDAAIYHGADLDAHVVEPIEGAAQPAAPTDNLDIGDVIGQAEAVDALVTAAAGGHHLMMLGPPGAGKTMIAERLPGILPDLTVDEALEAASVRSLAGEAIGSQLRVRPSYESPHHTATTASIIGGGSGTIRPGAAARAVNGVLFLDEAPEFQRTVLDALRQPLESGVITIHRANAVAQFPGRFQLVIAANPCPCGLYGSAEGTCTCPPAAIRRYLGRLSGPLRDRVDNHLNVPRVSAAHLRVAEASSASRPRSSEARVRVSEARAKAADRLRATPWTRNAEVTGAWLRGEGALSRHATATIDRALERGSLTMRGYDRVLRVAWTVCDLAGSPHPTAEHVGKALYLRKGMTT